MLGNDHVRLLATLASGATADTAARQLNISTRTVRRQLEHIRNRIGVDTTVQAIVWAAKRDLI